MVNRPSNASLGLFHEFKSESMVSFAKKLPSPMVEICLRVESGCWCPISLAQPDSLCSSLSFCSFFQCIFLYSFFLVLIWLFSSFFLRLMSDFWVRLLMSDFAGKTRQYMFFLFFLFIVSVYFLMKLLLGSYLFNFFVLLWCNASALFVSSPCIWSTWDLSECPHNAHWLEAWWIYSMCRSLHFLFVCFVSVETQAFVLSVFYV